MERDNLGCIEYYFGVYCQIYKPHKRVLQVVNTIDSLSCEILANQFGEDCCLRCGFSKVKYMIDAAKLWAKNLKCDYIEINCKDGAGSYRWMRAPGR